MPSIFDFDQTLSIEHTFSDHCIEEASKRTTDQYTAGKSDAKKNTKKKAEDFLKHDDQNLSAIATYHNNPDYVAGYIATILKKELKLVNTIKSKDEPVVAINMYQVEGLEKPFLISYLPHQDNKFQETMSNLGNKNKQVEFIRQQWLEMSMIKNDTVIDFYEDSGRNFTGAKKLNYISGHLVDGDADTFKIVESYPASSMPVTAPVTVQESLRPIDVISSVKPEPAKEKPTVTLESEEGFENKEDLSKSKIFGTVDLSKSTIEEEGFSNEGELADYIKKNHLVEQSEGVFVKPSVESEEEFENEEDLSKSRIFGTVDLSKSTVAEEGFDNEGELTDYIKKNHLVMEREGVFMKPQVEEKFDDIKLDPLKVEAFKNQLTKIRKKADQLAYDGYRAAAHAANELHSTLSGAFNELEHGQMKPEQFGTICNDELAIAHVELDKHRGWKEFLGNLAVAILGLGIGLLIKGAVNACNNRPFMFFAKTDSAQILDETEEVVKEFTALNTPL